MRFPNYNVHEIEEQILTFWKENKTVEKLRERNKNGKKFYFLQGPPYTSGKIHMGHAWNMALKDMTLRYKRMKGLNVWDRMGYDMHGLPTEQKVMKKFGLKNKDEIEAFGVGKFTKECEIFCKEMMLAMDVDFQRLGATLDFTNPYQPIKHEFMDAEWWLIKQAHEKGRLYQGLRTMHWDSGTASSVAKHELEYKSIKDTAIFVKFKRQVGINSYFIIWTTTPWTIPLNLAIMVNPNMDYVEVEVPLETGNEVWVIAKELLESVLEKAKVENHTILREFKGDDLAGEKYDHPLNTLDLLPEDLQKCDALFTVLLSREHVDASAGTGLVHCAPGCGPEDYEVGYKNGIAPFNCVNEEGYFADFGDMTGMKAKTDDVAFIKLIHSKGALLAKESYVHDYPHGERSHEPVIFRTTKQWFFKIEDLKQELLDANEDIYWYPESGKNAFRSWLENLRDNSITKQRYWGTPVPIWRHEETDETIVIGSLKELEELSGQKVEDMHIPFIDTITIERDGKVFKRIPDVLDVWIDAGTTSWNCLDFPRNEELFNEWFPADFILEGKDQIRGWFNLLMVSSMLGFKRPSFKNVYMHGFITDIDGTKMSKSLGNVTSPYEVIDKHGADTLRFYMNATSAGEDIAFSWDELKVKYRHITIIWNIHNLFLGFSKGMSNPLLTKVETNELALEDKFILSKLHTTIKEVSELFEAYKLDLIIPKIQDFFLELSRTYIQLVRDRISSGTKREKEICLHVIATSFFEALKMFGTIAPMISEAMYLNMKEMFNLTEESIGNYSWPEFNEDFIDVTLEKEFEVFNTVLQSGLHSREKGNMGVRWPMKELVVVSKNELVVESVERLRDLLKQQLNIKDITVLQHLPNATVIVKADYKTIGRVFGKLTQKVIATLKEHDDTTIVDSLTNNGKYTFTVEDEEVTILPDHVTIERDAPEGFVGVNARNLSVYLNTQVSTELEAEGFAREVMRKVQSMRKDAELERDNEISLNIVCEEDLFENLKKFENEIKAKVGAQDLTLGTSSQNTFENDTEFVVKKKKFSIGFKVL